MAVRAAGSKEQKNEYLNKKGFLHFTDFKLMRKIKGNSANNCNFFNARNLSGAAIVTARPGCQKPRCATGYNQLATVRFQTK